MDISVQCSMCRICMRSDSKMVLIGLFEHIVQAHTLAHVVSLVGAVEVQQDDELPKLCCTQCLREVEAAYKVRNLCQESDVKLRSHLPNMVAVLKKEPFCDDELNSRSSEDLARSKAGCAQTELVELISFTPDSKYECDEISIEEICLINANYSKLDQCSDTSNVISYGIDENCFNDQGLEADVAGNKPRQTYNHGLPKCPKSFDIYPAVKFSCCGCVSSFDTFEELHAHGRAKHCDKNSKFPLRESQCDICFKILRNGQSYDVHKRNIMYNYRCRICDQILITWQQALAHRRLKHARSNRTADEALQCCGCEMRFASAEELKVHSETIHLPENLLTDKKKPIICNICYRSYSTNRQLRSHKIGYLKRCKKRK